jgi:uncharacterized protein YecE (DUF72 family)
LATSRSRTPARKAQPTGALRVGTSGWSYEGWWGPFFPEELRKADALAYYASRFDCVELNAPHYRTPTPEAVTGWAERTPDQFRFAWKASRFITHWKRLLNSENSLELMEDRMRLLGKKLGPVLFQLHPAMQANRDRLAEFIALLNPKRQYTFEFRHPSWYTTPVLELLRDHDVALCLSDHADAPAPREVTASWVYVRNHGPSGRYHGSYSDAALKDWAKSIRAWRKQGRDVWCFFDNDVKSAAPADADRLLAALKETPRTRREWDSGQH